MINHTATRTVESWKLKGKAFAELPSDDLTMLYHDAPAAKAMRMTMPTGLQVLTACENWNRRLESSDHISI